MLKNPFLSPDAYSTPWLRMASTGSQYNALDTLIAVSGDGRIAQQLTTQFDKTNLLASASQAQLIVSILDEQWQRRTASLDNRSRAAQYRITLTTAYQIRHAKGSIIDAKRNAIATRTLTVDEDDIAGKRQEETLIKADIERQVLKQIQQRVQFIAQQSAH